MPLTVNLQHLMKKTVELSGELPAAELELGGLDKLVQPSGPLVHELTVEQMEGGILVQGSLRLPLRCGCVRCLEPFELALDLPGFAALVPLEGEDRAPVVDDCVDLTPYLREDILLTLPQHPLCKPDCRGLSQLAAGGASGETPPTNAGASAWAALNKLKLKN